MYGSFVPTSDERPFLMQREKVCVCLTRLRWVYVLLMVHILSVLGVLHKEFKRLGLKEASTSFN